MSSHSINPVFRALNRQMLLLGVERRLFFFLLISSLAFFQLFNALAPAIALFVALWNCARLAQCSDPQFLRVLLSSGRWRFRYDSAKWSPTIERGGSLRGSAQGLI
jgi:type IV secretory pathway VirB3-like protein